MNVQNVYFGRANQHTSAGVAGSKPTSGIRYLPVCGLLLKFVDGKSPQLHGVFACRDPAASQKTLVKNPKNTYWDQAASDELGI